jgi:hypothetical protein
MAISGTRRLARHAAARASTRRHAPAAARTGTACACPRACAVVCFDTVRELRGRAADRHSDHCCCSTQLRHRRYRRGERFDGAVHIAGGDCWPAHVSSQRALLWKSVQGRCRVRAMAVCVVPRTSTLTFVVLRSPPGSLIYIAPGGSQVSALPCFGCPFHVGAARTDCAGGQRLFGAAAVRNGPAEALIERRVSALHAQR